MGGAASSEQSSPTPKIVCVQPKSPVREPPSGSPLLQLEIVLDNPLRFPLKIRSKDTVGTLRERVAQQLGVPPEILELSFSNNVLGLASSSMEDAAICDGARVEVFPKNGKSFKEIQAAAQKEACMIDVHKAAQAGDLEALEKVFLHAPHRIDERNAYEATPLHVACEVGHTNIAAALLKAKADVNAQNFVRQLSVQSVC